MQIASPCFIPPHVNHRPDWLTFTLLHRMCQWEISEDIHFFQTGLRITRAIQTRTLQEMKHRSLVRSDGLIHDHRPPPQGQPLRQFSTNAGTPSGSATRWTACAAPDLASEYTMPVSRWCYLWMLRWTIWTGARWLYLREAPAGFGLERLATAFMIDSG